MKEQQPKIDDFKYVYAWHKTEAGKVIDWVPILMSDVQDYQYKQANNFQCFVTVQRFATKDKVKGEAFIAPLYFDLDYGPNPAVSQADAVKIVEFFINELGVKESDIFIYFSGSKGFHILIYSQVFGIQPRADLHKIYKHIARDLSYRLGETVTDEETQKEKVIPLMSMDYQVYTEKRMLRLPNSVHEKTRLYKIELSFHDIRTKSLEEIKTLAERPGESVFQGKTRSDSLDVRKTAAAYFTESIREYEQGQATKDARYDRSEFVFKKGEPPACVQDIYKGGWKKDGDRNQATVQLATYYKEAGHTKEETIELLESWVLHHTSDNTNYGKQQRVANTRSTIEAVYEGEYRFHCAFIRSLHGPKDPEKPKEYTRVACVGESLCPCVKKKGKDEGDEAPERLHLSKTGDADLNGKLITTDVMVAGKKHTPYIVPKRIEYHCWGRKGCRKPSCPLYNIENGVAYKDLSYDDRELIQMAGTGDDNIRGILRELSGIPACQKYDTEVVESTNVEELLVIPMAQGKATDGIEDEGKYVQRKVYVIGKSQVTENKYYRLTGYVFPHPKNMEATIIVRDADPLQDVIESFKVTDKIRQDLAILHPADYTTEAIVQKLEAVLNDLTYNVTGIVERDDALLGVLLVMHSILRFRVPWDNEPIRGWLELKLTGDTATGKSNLIRKVMEFAGVGTKVNAESTSRTGLTYKMEQTGSGGAWYIIWGAWPLADKEMIWVDEDTGIGKDEYGEMTLARSEGRLEVKRAVSAETACRVRAILSGNPPNGKQLGDYGQGVEVLKDVFNNEDIRRFDFAIFMRQADVPAENYNRSLDTYPKMLTAETLKNSILYAWSRKPEDVVFRKDAIEAILSVSTDLSKVYGTATDVPLVSPSDQRNKVARMAVALAALTHSVDESGERIEVTKGHVDFIGMYLKDLYNAPGCGLNYYAKLSLKVEDMGDDLYEKLSVDLKKLDVLKHDYKYYEFIQLFARQKYLRLGEIESMLAIDKDESKAIVNLLVKMKMLLNTSGGFRKTPRFNAFISKCFEHGIFDNVQEEY